MSMIMQRNANQVSRARFLVVTLRKEFHGRW